MKRRCEECNRSMHRVYPATHGRLRWLCMSCGVQDGFDEGPQTYVVVVDGVRLCLSGEQLTNPEWHCSQVLSTSLQNLDVLRKVELELCGRCMPRHTEGNGMFAVDVQPTRIERVNKLSEGYDRTSNPPPAPPSQNHLPPSCSACPTACKAMTLFSSLRNDPVCVFPKNNTISLGGCLGMGTWICFSTSHDPMGEQREDPRRVVSPHSSRTAPLTPGTTTNPFFFQSEKRDVSPTQATLQNGSCSARLSPLTARPQALSQWAGVADTKRYDDSRGKETGPSPRPRAVSATEQSLRLA